jgi:hypothetical protein
MRYTVTLQRFWWAEQSIFVMLVLSQLDYIPF